MDRLDNMAMLILQGLMLRYKEKGYNDEYAINEAYRLAALAIEVRNNGVDKEV